MRIPFAAYVRDCRSRMCGVFAFAHGIIRFMKDHEARIRAAARKRARAKAVFDAADEELRAEFVSARADGVGPSDMSRWSGMTREWVAKIAPAPKRS